MKCHHCGKSDEVVTRSDGPYCLDCGRSALGPSDATACSASSGGILVTCADCGTKYEMGNGQLAAAEKRGHYHHLGHCPKCDRKTWSEAFPVRPMTRAEIAAAFHSPQNDKDLARRALDSE